MKRFRIATLIGAIAVAVFTATSHDLLGHSDSTPGLLVVALLPFVVDALRPEWLRRPAVGLAAVGLVFVSVVGLTIRYPDSPDFVGFLFVILSARVAAEAPTPVSLAVALVAMVLAVLLGIAGVLDTAVNLVVGTAFAWFAGYEVRAHHQLTRELVRAQTALADQAAAAERQRIARELHDLIAHTLSVTMLHLTGARLALEDADIG
jgi:signal transduction histidine kinase